MTSNDYNFNNQYRDAVVIEDESSFGGMDESEDENQRKSQNRH